MTTEQLPALSDQASTELAITGSQTTFTDNQVALLRQVGIEDATDADLDLFFHVCRRTGLDPFARQIYMIGRDTKVSVRVQLPNGNSRVEEQRVTKFTIQTGIDGYRLIGSRAARAAQQLVSHDEPQWVGKDGVWRDFWTKADGTPVAAKYTIRVDGAPFTATCMFEEYAQYSSKGELTAMWKKMPANQVAKCAEAQAWRKAYPADFSGIVLEGTDQGRVIDSSGAPVRVPSQRRGVDGLRQAIGSAPQAGLVDSAPAPSESRPKPDTTQVSRGEPMNDPNATTDTADQSDWPPVTKPQLQKLSILRQREKYDDTDEGRADWFQWVQLNIGRLVASNKDLTKAEAGVLIDVLESTTEEGSA